MRTWSLFLLHFLMASYAWCQSGAADNHALPHAGDEKLGAISFAISCAPEVQKPFERGVALLHSFEFEQADLQFQEVAVKDPHCAMAYWGSAMSIYHQLWSRPTATDLKDGWGLVQEARRARAGTEREKDYIEALAHFYGNYKTVSREKRVAAYTQAMEQLWHRYPDDREAAIWYALALLSSDFGDPESVNQKKAIDLLQRLFKEVPGHPGVAHYLIHACDQPGFAPLALDAARKYAAIAPSSSHAVHMPSHIFARLGLWHDDINSNLAALEVAREHQEHMEVAHHELHSMDFLVYAYLQIGEDTKAKAIVDQVENAPRAEAVHGEEYYNYARVEFPALLTLETRRWKEALAMTAPPNIEPWNRAIVYWTRAVAAGHLRDAAAARAAVKQYDLMLDKTRKSSRRYEVDGMGTNRDEARAWLQFALGKNAEALRLLRSVAEDQDKAGKGEVELPAREMLGDMLLELNRPADALVEYEKSLHTDPNRFNGLYGAARAAELAGEKNKASDYYARLLANCPATSDRRELAQARAAAANAN